MSEPAEDWAQAQRAGQGDETAFSALVSRYQQPIYAFLYRSLGREEIARDLAQETFVRAWFALPRLRPSGKFSTWLFQIALNLCRDYARSKAARQDRLSDSLPPFPENTPTPGPSEPPHPALPPDQAAVQTEEIERLERQIRLLPENLREAFQLCALEGLSQKEAAEVLRLSPKAVEAKVYRARKVLLERLR